MNKEEFINKAVDMGCEWREGTHNSLDGYYVRYPVLKSKVHMAFDAIEANDWATLKRNIIQERVENWNRSKVGELRDRQKGNYSV